jgi:hypothetical protein
MAYNNRMSQQFNRNQQQQGRGRKKEDENDALMRLVSLARSLRLLSAVTDYGIN